MQKLDAIDSLYLEQEKIKDAIFDDDFFNLEDSRQNEYYKKLDEIQKDHELLVENLLSSFYIEKDIDYYDMLNQACEYLKALYYGKNGFVDSIKEEQKRRHTRKRQPKKVKERCIELELWEIK